MDIFTLLNRHEQVFVDDPCEDNKIRKLINNVNHTLADIVTTANDFQGFAEAQLEGEYHKKLVMVKSLLYHYATWQPMVKAYARIEKEESIKVDQFYSMKAKLLADLRTMLKLSYKFAIVCQYDVFFNDFRRCPENHSAIILGDNNNEILKSMITLLDSGLHIKGCFEEIETKNLPINYANVIYNVKQCNQKLEMMYSNDLAKYSKLKESINRMEEIGKAVVMFTTYRPDLAMIGISKKELDSYEKEITKSYIPYKRQLKQALDVEFEDICDIVVNENLFRVAGEDGYVPDFKTYNSNEVTFVANRPSEETNLSNGELVDLEEVTEPTDTYTEDVTYDLEEQPYAPEEEQSYDIEQDVEEQSYETEESYDLENVEEQSYDLEEQSFETEESYDLVPEETENNADITQSVEEEVVDNEAVQQNPEESYEEQPKKAKRKRAKSRFGKAFDKISEEQNEE